MIRSLKILDLEQAACQWSKNLPFFQKNAGKEIEFKPGVNIIVGPNGSGKSTILKTIAMVLHAYQGGVQMVTESSMREIKEFMGKTCRHGVVPDHDGSPLIYADPSKAVGLIGGSFDDDFLMQGIQNTVNRGSAGQTVMMRLNPAIKAIMGGVFPEVDWKIHESRVMPEVKELLAGTGDKVCPTIIFDEPVDSLDFLNEFLFWGFIKRAVDKAGVQIIMASHSLMTLTMTTPHFIETEDGYLAKAKDLWISHLERTK